MRFAMTCSLRRFATQRSTAVCQTSLSLAIFALLAACSPWAVAQVSRIEAERMGLVSAWQSQVQLPRSGRGLVSSHLWADPSVTHQYAVVELPDRTLRISAEQLDRRGNPIGLAEAKKLLAARAQRLVPASGAPVEVLEVSVPLTYLVLVSSDGVVQNFDAETGALKWTTACGRSGAPAHPAAVSPAGVTLIHGIDLYLLDWKSGEKLMVQPLRHGTSNAIGVCNDIAFVSDFNGKVETYGLGRELSPWSYQLYGHAVGHPVTTADQAFVCFGTDKGYAYVLAGGENPSLWLRYETSPSISGSVASANNAFYVAGTSGVLGKITLENRMGTIAWEYPSGKVISHPALVVNNHAFVATEAGDLIALDDKTGQANWSLPLARISQPISVLGEHVVCVTSSRQLTSIDVKTGKYLATTGVIQLAEPVRNALNDRVYIVTTTGAVQCLRPIEAELPTMFVPTDPNKLPVIEKPAMESIETGESPFGAPAGSTESNPFGGDDPFGGSSGGDPSDDPFGGDPFGGF